MTADLLLYIMLGIAVVSAIASQRLVGGKQPTGPDGAVAFVTLCRVVIAAGWVWFAFLTGYWQIVALIVGVAVITYAGILAKKATS